MKDRIAPRVAPAFPGTLYTQAERTGEPLSLITRYDLPYDSDFAQFKAVLEVKWPYAPFCESPFRGLDRAPGTGASARVSG